MDRHRIAVSACALALLGASGLAQAANISWSTGPGFGGANGFEAILTNGALVQAVDFGGGPATRTVDPGGANITFTVVDPAFFFGFIFGAGSAGSTDTGWNAVINDADFNNPGDISVPNFLTGLTVGSTYQLQLFASDTRGCCSARQSRFGDGNGNFSEFVVQGSLTSIVGSFVADATSQAVEFDTTSNAPILNAYVLRNLTPAPVPLPAGLGLMVAGVATLGGVLGRRRA